MATTVVMPIQLACATDTEERDTGEDRATSFDSEVTAQAKMTLRLCFNGWRRYKRACVDLVAPRLRGEHWSLPFAAKPRLWVTENSTVD